MSASDPLEPKPPETVQKLEWLRRHGWQYKWHIVFALVFALILFILPLAGWLLRGGWPFPKTENGESAVNKPPQQLENQDTAPSDPTDVPTKKQNALPDLHPPAQPGTPPAEKLFLDTGEGPDEIIEALDGFVGIEREARAKELYENRWVRDPGWVGIVFGLPKQLDFDYGWLVSLTGVRRSSEAARSGRLTFLITKMDASHLRTGMHLRFTGRIREVSTSEVHFDNAVFDVVEVDNE